MADPMIVRLLERRGIWMTAVEIFDASPDYPLGDYVLRDLEALRANALVVARRRSGTALQEYGLPAWTAAKTPAQTLAQFIDALRRLIRRFAASV